MNELNNQIENLLKRVFIFLEDGEWEKADEYCEKALDLDPENATAYLGKLMVQMRVKQRDLLNDIAQPIETNVYYKKILKYDYNGDLAQTVSDINNAIITRNEMKRKDDEYNRALAIYNGATTMENCNIAAAVFKKISGYKDADQLAVKCAEKSEICRKNSVYNAALLNMQQPSVTNFENAKKLFSNIQGWRDTDELLAKCDEGIAQLLQAQKTAQEEKERQAEIKREKVTKSVKKLKRAVIITLVSLCILAVGVFSFTEFAVPAMNYNNALKLIEEEEYEDAYNTLEELGDYKDSKKLLKNFTIKFTTEITFLNGEKIGTSKYEYDKNGNETKYISYDENGDIRYWREYEYDENGNLTKDISYDENGDITEREESEYDKNGNLTKRASYGLYGDIDDCYVSEYEYDKNGNETKYISYDENGDIRNWDEYEYDKNGNKTKYTSYDENGDISYWREYEYDKNGNTTKYTSYDENGDISYWGEYEYDKNGNMIKEVGYKVNGDISYWREYDKNGNCTKAISYDENGDISYWNESEYDKNGNQTKGISYDENGDISFWDEFEYDKNGNMTKSISYDENGDIECRYEYKYEGRLFFYNINKEKS